MIISSRSCNAGGELTASVCIVGAGAAGITLACELDGAPFPVILLEAGGPRFWPFTSNEPYKGTAIEPHPPVDTFRRRAFGGSTTIWGGRCVPLDPIDFERRDYAANSGWPISYKDYAAHLPRAMQYCEAGDADFSAQSALPSSGPAIPGLSAESEIDGSVIERYSLPTNFGARYKKILADSSNIRVITGAHVLKLRTDRGGARVESLLVQTRAGDRLAVKATVFVLALGGIETTRLLMVSDTDGGGIGNHSDCLGRYYACHVENVIGAFRPRRPGIPFDFERSSDGVYVRRKLQVREETQRHEKILNIAFRLHYPAISDPGHKNPVLSAAHLAKWTLRPEYRFILSQDGGKRDAPASVLRHAANVARGLPRLSGFSAYWLRRRVLAKRKVPYLLAAGADGTYPIEYNSEQTPLADSRITLAPERDAYGVQRVHVNWRFCQTDVDSICKAYRLLARTITLSGAGVLEFDDASLPRQVAQSRPVAGHHMGSTRMAAAASAGVVNADCAVFGVPNLYIASTSVFPTSGHANPTLTLIALTIRMAKHLRDRFARPCAVDVRPRESALAEH